MKIKFGIEKKQLNNFLKKQKYSQFLQSWQWGEFQENLGNKIFRIGVEENGELLAIATLIKKNIGLGKAYFYSPRGPVVNEFRIQSLEFRIEEVEEFIFKEIKKIAKKENVIFLRFEPIFEIRNSKFEIIKSIPLQPKKTLMLDLSKSEEDLLKAMHQKTRYNIRLAQKKGVEIVEGSIDDFDDFWKLMNTTSERDNFRIHSREHYRRMLKIDFVKLYLAKYNNVVIAGGIFSFYGDTAVYMHGASSNEYRNVMSPPLLQWKVAMIAQKQNFRYYDFYGIDEKKWPGVTRFKRGFGGFEQEYPGTLDMVFNSVWYSLYRIFRGVRRRIR